MDNNQNLSNKELHDLKKQEKMAEKESLARRKKLKSLAIWGGVAVVVLGSILGLVRIVENTPDPTETALLTETVSAADWFLGGKETPVVLVEYGDYQCPACSAYHNFTKQLVAEFGEKITFVYRHFPLRQIHPNANLAAQAAEAAGEQNKFWEMHNMLYENQNAWAKSPSAEKIFIEYATTLGLNIDKFKTDFDSDAVKDKIEKDLASAKAANLPGTPSFFLNGKSIENPQSYEQFRILINQAGAAAPSPLAPTTNQ